MTRLFETEYSATLNVDSFDALDVQTSPTGSWVHIILKSGEEFEAMRPTNDGSTLRIYHLLVQYWLSEDLANRIVTYKDLHDGTFTANEAHARAESYIKKRVPVTAAEPTITTTGTGSGGIIPSAWPSSMTWANTNGIKHSSGSDGVGNANMARIKETLAKRIAENKERR